MLKWTTVAYMYIYTHIYNFFPLDKFICNFREFSKQILEMIIPHVYSFFKHFKNLLGKYPKITDKPIMKIINNQLVIKLGQFTQEKLNVVWTKIKNRKAASLDEIPPEVWKTRNFDDLLLWYCSAVYNQNTIERWTKGCILLFPKKREFRIAKNYWGITLTSMVAKIYNALL